MKIRRRFALSFFVILALFMINQAVSFWSSSSRVQAMHSLERALTRQTLIASIRQDLENLHRQVTLLNQIQTEGTVGARPDQHSSDLFKQQLTKIRQSIAQLAAISQPEDRARVEELRDGYEKVADAWSGFYEYLGGQSDWSVLALIRADPIVRHLITEAAPALQEKERTHVQDEQRRFDAATRLTDRLTLAVLIVSTCLALFLVYRLSRYLVGGLDELARGAALIGNMKLDHRIATHKNDEIGQLGMSFNNMAEKLAVARADLEQRNSELALERRKAQDLLLNILPAPVAGELQEHGSVAPKYFEDVTIFFSDIVGFARSTQQLAVENLVERLNVCFTAFDRICEKYGLEKLKTIGDSYMCAGGIPVRSPSHAVDTVLAAFEMLDTVNHSVPQAPGEPWAIRIGIHTGPVIAGVVGIRKFAFDVWGDSVNIASRMESGGEPGRVNISAGTYVRIKDFFQTEYRGKAKTKEGRELDMYFVTAVLPELLDSDSIPPAPFRRRYQTYFGKALNAFPHALCSNSRGLNSSALTRL